MQELLLSKNKKGNTLLHESVESHRYDVAIELLEASRAIRIKARPLEAMASMHVDEGNEVVTMDIVLLSLSNADGDTPLFLTVKVGRLEGFKRLIKYVASATNVLKKSKVFSKPHLTNINLVFSFYEGFIFYLSICLNCSAALMRYWDLMLSRIRETVKEICT